MEPIIFNIPPMSDDSLRPALAKLSDDEAYVDKLVYMAQGNPGAMNVLVALHQVDTARAAWCLGKCMAWNIRGSLLWLLYKDVCKMDADNTLKRIELDEAPDDLSKLPYANYTKPNYE